MATIPGPKSEDLAKRRAEAVATGVSSSLPFYVARGHGATLFDVDGNEFIDLGSGIAVTGVGHRDPRLVRNVSEQVERFTHTCFMVAPYEGYVAVCEELNALDSRRPRQAFGAVQLRCGGGRERGEDRALRDRPSSGRCLRPRVPRAHEPHDGAHREGDAVQGRLRTVRARDVPCADVVSVPRPGEDDRRGSGVAGDRRDRNPSRRVARRGGPRRADPRRRWLYRACRGLPADARRVVRGSRGRCSSPTRSSPVSVARVGGSRPSTRASFPTSSRRRKGSPVGCRSPG